jgi:hypothetical protein
MGLELETNFTAVYTFERENYFIDLKLARNGFTGEHGPVGYL